MFRLGFFYGHQVLPHDVALLLARFALLRGDHSPIAVDLRSVIQRFDQANSAADTQLLFVVGRELEGYDQFWDAGRHVSDQVARCIDVYLTITHCARVAALQTISSLKQRGIPRDVAVLIGRLVYATRDDAILWLVLEAPPTKGPHQ